MTLQEFIASLREEFHARLERKTGWGKEEVKVEFERAVTDILAATVHNLSPR